MLLFLMIALWATLLFVLIFGIKGQKGQLLEKRIGKFLPQHNAETGAIEGKQANKDEKKTLLSTLSQPFRHLKMVEKWDPELEKAALGLQSSEFFVIRLIGAMFGGMMALALGFPLGLVVLGLIVGYFIPTIYVKRRKEARIGRSAAQLPQVLGTMETALKAGFSFVQAMQSVGKEVSDPLGPEFSRTVREINLGIPMEEAFGQLLDRLPNDDLKLVVTALLVQRSTGGNLAEILGSMQETISERVRIKDELQTLTAQGRMSAWIITLLPVGLGLMLNVINPEYFAPMLEHPLGWALLFFASISGVMGWLMIQKIVDVEV